MLGPSTALYERFLKHCTLTNKAVGTIWGPCPNLSEATGSWSLSPLIVSRDSFGPSYLSSLSAGRSTAGPIRMSLNIFCDIYYLLTMLFVYWFLWPLRLVWLLVCCLYKEVYLHIFKYVSFWLHGYCGEWEGGPVNQVNHTSWVAVVAPTDRPKSLLFNRTFLWRWLCCHFALLTFLLV